MNELKAMQNGMDEKKSFFYNSRNLPVRSDSDFILISGFFYRPTFNNLKDISKLIKHVENLSFKQFLSTTNIHMDLDTLKSYHRVFFYLFWLRALIKNNIPWKHRVSYNGSLKCILKRYCL